MSFLNAGPQKRRNNLYFGEMSGENPPAFVSFAQTTIVVSTPNITRALTIPSGNHVFVFVRWNMLATSISSLTDTLGNVYTPLTRFNSDSPFNSNGQWFHCLNAIGGATTITATFSANPTNTSMGVYVFSGELSTFDGQAGIDSNFSGVLTITTPVYSAPAGLLLYAVSTATGSTGFTLSDGLTGNELTSAPGVVQGKMAFIISDSPFVAEQITATWSPAFQAMASVCSFH